MRKILVVIIALAAVMLAYDKGGALGRYINPHVPSHPSQDQIVNVRGTTHLQSYDDTKPDRPPV